MSGRPNVFLQKEEQQPKTHVVQLHVGGRGVLITRWPRYGHPLVRGRAGAHGTGAL